MARAAKQRGVHVSDSERIKHYVNRLVHYQFVICKQQSNYPKTQMITSSKALIGCLSFTCVSANYVILFLTYYL
jgi:hypothetical protein